MKTTRRLVNTAFIYAIAAMVGGVFYREFTKFTMFDGQTSLSVLHTHLFLLGMFFFVILALVNGHFELSARRGFWKFYWLYNAGVTVTAVGLIWRGVVQVLGLNISIGVDAAISGISGLGHIMTGIGIILFFVLLRRQLSKDKAEGQAPAPSKK